jgi:hypothetical protein
MTPRQRLQGIVAWEADDAGDCRSGTPVLAARSAGRLTSTISNPLRLLGLARVLAGSWFVTSGALTLRQHNDLVPQAQRLLGSDSGSTGAPMRALLMLVTAGVLVLIGVVLAAKGVAWMRRVPLRPEGPAAIDRGEVVGALRDHQLFAYAAGPAAPYWPLRRWLADQLADMTWWRREIMSQGAQALVRSCGAAIVLGVCCLALPRIMTDDLVGPFPTSFVITLPFVTAIWAVLGLMLISSAGPRIESEELPLPARVQPIRDLPDEPIIESRPGMLDREPPGLALTLGATGIAVQCLMLWWWNLSPIDFPLRTTSIVRHAGSIAGGMVFFVVGGRMVAAATKLLLVFRYESMLILIDGTAHPVVARAAEVRTESLGLYGPRHVVAAVGGSYVRDSAPALIRERAGSSGPLTTSLP